MNDILAGGVILFATDGSDARDIQDVLAEDGIAVAVAADLPGVIAGLRTADLAIVTAGALGGADLSALTDVMDGQPEWSDLPFIVLTDSGGRQPDLPGNVTFLDRPIRPATLLSVARSARRARLRQYDARRRLEEIREGQHQLTIALAAGGMGNWTLDVATRTLQASNDCKAHYGREANDPFDYADLLASIHPEDLPAMQAAVRRSLDSGDPYDIEYRNIWPDGSLHWVHVNGRVGHDAAGQVTRVVGVSHEITRHRRTELRQRALLTLSDRLREAKDGAEMSYRAAEILGTTLGVSRAGYGTIDPVRETITVKRDWNMPGIHSLAGTLHFRDYGSYIEDLKAGRTAAIADARLDPRTADTAAALEGISARAFVNLPIVENGAFVALLYLNHDAARPWSDDDLAFVRDVADRTRAAVERRNAEMALATLAETLERQVEDRTRERDRTWQNSQDLLAIVAEDGTFLAVNPAWTRVLGWTANEIVGQHYVAFSHPDDQAGSGAALLQALNEPLNQYENRVRHKDGSYRWLSWVATAAGDRVYASGRHITAEREAQAELEAAQAQLRQAQKMEAVGQLTGGLAHDFNNLLTAISGSLELIQTRVRQGRTDAIDRYVDMAQQGAKRAAALTHRLLAFSRRQTLDPRPTDINRLIVSLDDLLRRSVGPGVEIEMVGAGGLWTTLIDPNQLENALLNLCINARDAMPGGGRITIETANKWLDTVTAKERDLPPGQYVSVCVTDTGSGMSAETIERAFDPFYTTKPLGEGTGLGLSMIYGFVRQSGGQVRIYSEIGQGTTMCLYLPRSHGEDAPEIATEGAIEQVASASGETVLVVDDEPAVRGLVVEILGDLGYHALEASDGQAGLAILDSGARIDLLITDVGLPKGMNGRQLADAARVGRPALKILFITGYAENAVVGNGHLDRGMHVLTKPFGLDALASRIRELIAG